MADGDTRPIISATQIQLWDPKAEGFCQRKWGFKYLDRVATPVHPSAALGTEVQDLQIDPYLTSGRPFDFSRPSGEIAQALVPIIPKPGAPGMRLRRKFIMPSPRGTFGYQGELDIWAPDSKIVPSLGGGAQLVGDIKTTGNLAFAKTDTTLRTDTQAQLYSMAIMFEESVDMVDLAWLYVRTRKPHRVQIAHARMLAPEVVDSFGRIDEVGADLVKTKLQRPKASDLPPNVRSCETFGGCPYRHICNISPSVFATSNERTTDMTSTVDFLANLRKVTAPPAVVHAPAPAVVHAPAPEPAPAPNASLSSFQRLIAKEAEAQGQPMGSFVPTGKAPPAPPAAVNPPESALPPAPATGSAKPGRVKAASVPLGDSVADLADVMRKNGVKRLVLTGGTISEIEVG
jgi:hypothetical protein